MRYARLTRWLGLSMVLVSVGLTGCGGGDDRAEIEHTLSSLRSAYLEQDYAAACEHLSRRAQRELGNIGHEYPTRCDKDFERRLSAKVVSAGDLKEPVIESLEVEDDRAVAAVRVEKGAPVTTQFVREDGDWKLARLFGRQVRSGAAARIPSPASSVPLRAALVRASGKTSPCPSIQVDETSTAGGCQLVGQANMALWSRTVFGDRRLGSCPILFIMHVDSRGRFAFSDLTFQLSREVRSDICGDVTVCASSDGELVPWEGRLVRSPGAAMRAVMSNMCLDTCLARFSGAFAFGVAELDGGGLRLNADKTPVGSSGLDVSGTWRLRPADSDTHFAIDFP